MTRRGVTGCGADIHALAEQHGYRLVFTVVLDTGPLVAALAIAQHVYEHNAAAVIIPGFEHADSVRHIVPIWPHSSPHTGIAARLPLAVG
ncbi:hypothetical protein IU434_28905 [Nocardia farcinica]|uniref:hypothetical protein n=1 Tax=Nocardia farcinica TaxID=37329 RepID=UPI001892DD18|nr:hypothetical protein [Nocardia farcinica]MBF6446020.1 hypothetical protein [Nocardia farcinica]